MAIIKGTFYLPNGRPATGATLTLELSREAKAMLTTGEELNWPDDYEPKIIELNDRGEIPPDTTIIGNDQLLPEGTDYEVRIIHNAGDGEGPTTIYHNWLQLVGSEPIDIPSLDPELQPAPAPPPPPPPLPFGPPQQRKSSGFFAGLAKVPNGSRPTAILYNGFNNGAHVRDKGIFKVEAFSLSRRTTVDRVSIHVNTPSPVPRQQVVVGLYDLKTHKKVLEAAIDATRPGFAYARFAPITLGAGDFAFAWAPARPCNVLRVTGVVKDIEDAIVSVLMNLDHYESRLSQGVAGGRKGRALPETLGVVQKEECSHSIQTLSGDVMAVTLDEHCILAYFDKSADSTRDPARSQLGDGQ